MQIAPGADDQEIYSGILERMSSHIDGLASQVFEMEKSVATHLSSDGMAHNNAIKDFQGLDFLRQSLEDLALLSLLVARSVQLSEGDVSAIALKLKLLSTQTLLSDVAAAAICESSHAPGDIDLF